MCGRGSSNATGGMKSRTCTNSRDGPARNLQARYNIAPTDRVEVVRPDGRQPYFIRGRTAACLASRDCGTDGRVERPASP